jgi:phage terminase large subunit-like protein
VTSPTITVRAGHPDFLDLPWSTPLAEWEIPSLVELPKGISRHTVRFVATESGIYAIKELPERPARNDYTVLRQLEDVAAPAVKAVGLVTQRSSDPQAEISAALITAYESFAFSYRELMAGPGFGPNRSRMLDAFAYLLVQLHLIGCFWGDCSLSNVLYRWDADTIETVMVDAETAALHSEGLTAGQRQEDIAIMIENVAGGMADIAALAGNTLDEADLALGEEVAERYGDLWTELADEIVIAADERFRIGERVQRINALGFDVDEIDVLPTGDGSEIRFKLRLGGRTFHARRLRDLTGIEARENQARQILYDLYYFQTRDGANSPTLKNVSAVRWRVSEFEPMIAALAQIGGVKNPIQAFCDLLHHRYLMATAAGRDVSTTEAFPDWIAAGRPGYPAPGY